MKCDNVHFAYRGSNPAGHMLAALLEDISIDFTSGSGLQETMHISDLGAAIRELMLAKRTPEPVAFDPDPSLPVIQTPVPTVTVMDRYVWQWLTAMNVPLGVPTTLRFVFANELPNPNQTDHRGTGC